LDPGAAQTDDQAGDQAAEDLARLAQHIDGRFALSRSGRLLREGPPDNGAAPRAFFGGSAGGNLLRLRQDVGAALARDLEALATGEPPWSDPDATPACLDALIERLSRATPVKAGDTALIYRLPCGQVFASDAVIVHSGAIEGVRLLARLAEFGMPPRLLEAGFVSLDDFWAPWCAALVDGEVAAMAFAARLGERAADVGVYTFPGFRGAGLAAAVTAAWSSSPSLADRALFYSTHRANRSSRQVAARLALRRIAVSVSIG
jgi:hypothetical protein